jgi:primary-amine oxidase
MTVKNCIGMVKTGADLKAQQTFPRKLTNTRPGSAFTRHAFAVLCDRKKNGSFEALIDLKSQRLLSWNEVKGVQPLVMDAEYTLLPTIVKSDVRRQAAMRKRGITDFEKVQIDGWAVGQVAAKYQRTRLLRALSYLK